tara:strand:- start:5624 stop:6559 length:936 start_codon:yes stop_codon:yes gene_type:complete
MTKKVNWLIAHKPVNLFIRTAKAFAKEIYEVTKGEYEIVIHEKESEEKFIAETGKTAVKALADNDYQMSQTEVYLIGRMHPECIDFLGLDLPYLFESHDHCSKVMEGPVGDKLNEKLHKNLGVKGLAYTYSGGYRNIGSNESVTSLRDLVGTTMRVGGNPINQDFIEQLGINRSRQSIQSADHWIDNLDNVEAKSVENTYTRFPEAKYWYRTNHNMFITDIMVADSFWNDLDEETREMFRTTAIKVARLERQWSEEDHDAFEKSAELHGKTITPVSDRDKNLMKIKSKAVYDKWSEKLSPGFVDEIKSQAE